MEAINSDGTISIATHVRGCLADFKIAGNSIKQAKADIQQKLPPGSIDDELGRFTIWSGNMGAHRKGRASLDYKLREASHIRERVLELLQNLRSVLKDALDIITGNRVSWEDLSDSGSDSSEDDTQSSEMPTTTELEQLVSNMTEINTCLMRLSISIRNPAPHDHFKESTNIDMAHYEDFDIAYMFEGSFLTLVIICLFVSEKPSHADDNTCATGRNIGKGLSEVFNDMLSYLSLLHCRKIPKIRQHHPNLDRQ